MINGVRSNVQTDYYKSKDAKVKANFNMEIEKIEEERVKEGKQVSVQTQNKEAEVKKLELEEKSIIRHEMNHKMIGGESFGMPIYVYKKGPDGKLYIYGGSVSISLKTTSNDPKEIIEKMDRVMSAAQCNGDASPKDMAAAGAAASKKYEAMQKLFREEEKRWKEKGLHKVEVFI